MSNFAINKIRPFYFILYNSQIATMNDSQSPVKTKTIVSSLQRLNRAASEGRFRIKSLRVKTLETQQQKCATDRDYEGDLAKRMYSKQFLKKLYIIRSEESQLKTSDVKYNAFVRSLHQRVINSTTLNLASCNFQEGSSLVFLQQFIRLNKHMICYDLSRCTYLAGYAQKTTGEPGKQWLVQKIIKNDQRIMRILLKNMSLVAADVKKIFDLVIETEKIYQLDLSNQSSQSMNRFSEEIQLLFDFCKRNLTCSILRLQNLHLRKLGVQHIQKGISANVANPLKVLSLKNNVITEQASLHISMLARSGLIELDISQNPLGPRFYLNLPTWKQNTIRKLNLSATEMNSQALIFFFSRIQQNKMLQILKLDSNDFSNHWFNHMKQVLQVNASIETLSLVDCQIKKFSQAFAGLKTNRYLKRFYISSNIFEEGVKELSDMLKLNKTLSQFRIRGCGLKPKHFVQIFQSLYSNSGLNSIDISENQVGQQGGKQILKALNKNSQISNLLHEKSQIPYGIREEIEQKINANREIKKIKELNMLKKQNRIVKQLDVHSWDDVSELEQKVKSNAKTILSLTSKVAGLEKQFDQKKIRFNEIKKDCNEKEEKLSNDIQNLLKQLKKIEEEEQNVLKKYKIKQNNMKTAFENEEKQIKNLQVMIEQESSRNKMRENQLEDFYQNFKYIQKKNQNKRETSQKKQGFDTSTAVNSKRKSRNL